VTEREGIIMKITLKEGNLPHIKHVTYNIAHDTNVPR